MILSEGFGISCLWGDEMMFFNGGGVSILFVFFYNILHESSGSQHNKQGQYWMQTTNERIELVYQKSRGA